ncbi:sensor histidine kinase [Streptomyces globisporus]|uniref:sensor histidine kinase n=1 Tax=Streptomyces globisporus TaxID=1908 RepID=UPI0007C52ECC|nr:ATP-binding protein [Streptomyces globisporus]
MSAPSTPFRPALLASLLTAAVGGALAVAATAAAPAGIRPALGWFAGGGVLLLAAAAFAVTWYGRTSHSLSRRVETLTAELAAQEARAARNAADFAREAAASKERYETEAAASEAAHRARTEELVRAHTARTAELTARRAADVRRLEAELRRAESGRSAAMAAAANAAGRMQALATSMLADLREMEHRHADEDVLADLLHLDHRTAQAGRLADSVAVLTGARSGRRWARPIVMESILRGAMGRIGGYQRVRLHSSSDAAVAGHAAEGVMHALAELMDNAANFSPPTAEVHVYVEEVPAGVIIAVEDSGLVMSDVQLRRAEAAVGSTAQDLAGLSGTRLGLAVVGRLARKHGLTVSFRPSARGGTGALLMLPQDLISHAPVEPPAAPAAVLPPVTGRGLTAPVPPEAPTVPAPAAAVEPETVHDSASESTGEHPRFGESGLPRRRRGRAMAAAHPEGPEAAVKPRAAGPRTGAAAGAATRFGTFRQAVRGTGTPAGEPRATTDGHPAAESPAGEPAADGPAAEVAASRPATEAVAEAPAPEAGAERSAALPAADAPAPVVPSDPADGRPSAPRTPPPSSNSPHPEGTPS